MSLSLGEAVEGMRERLGFRGWLVLKGKREGWLAEEAWEGALGPEALWDLSWAEEELGSGTEGPGDSAAVLPGLLDAAAALEYAQASTAATQDSVASSEAWAEHTDALSPHHFLRENAKLNAMLNGASLHVVASKGYWKMLETLATAAKVLFPAASERPLHTLSCCEGSCHFLLAISHFLGFRDSWERRRGGEGRQRDSWRFVATSMNPFHEETPGTTYPFPGLLSQLGPGRAFFGSGGRGDLLEPAFWAELAAVACPEAACESCAAEGRMRVDFATGDGGVTGWGDQEGRGYALLLAQALLGLVSVREGGALLLKCYELLRARSAGLVALLCSAFAGVAVFKPPLGSKQGNSERYLLAWGRRADSAVPLSSLVEFLRRQAGLGDEVGALRPAAALPPAFLRRLCAVSRAFADKQTRAIRLNQRLFQLKLRKPREWQVFDAALKGMMWEWIGERLRETRLLRWLTDAGATTREGPASAPWASFLGRPYVREPCEDRLRDARTTRSALALSAEELLAFARREHASLHRQLKKVRQRPASFQALREALPRIPLGSEGDNLWGEPVRSLYSSIFVPSCLFLLVKAVLGPGAGERLLSSELYGPQAEEALPELQGALLLRARLSKAAWLELLTRLYEGGGPDSLRLVAAEGGLLSLFTRFSVSALALLALRFRTLDLRRSEAVLEGRRGRQEWEEEVLAHLRRLSARLREEALKESPLELLSLLPLHALRRLPHTELAEHNKSCLVAVLGTAVNQS